MLDRYVLLVFGTRPLMFHSNTLETVKGMTHHQDIYMVIDMMSGLIIEDRRTKAIGDSSQAIYDFIETGTSMLAKEKGD